MPTVVELKKKCKQLGIKGYSTLNKIKLLQVIAKAGQGKAGEGKAGQGKAGQGKAGQGQDGQGKAGQGPVADLPLFFGNTPKVAFALDKQDQKIERQIFPTSIALSQTTLKSIEKKKLQQVTLDKFCSGKISKMDKPFLKATISLYIPYLNYPAPGKNLFKKDSGSPTNDNYVPTIYLFFEKEQKQQFIPVSTKLSIENFVDPMWLQKQNEYLASLSTFQKALLWAYTNNSFSSITPFFLAKLKITQLSNASLWNSYKSWAKYNTKVDPVTLAFFYCIHGDGKFLYHFTKNKLEEIKSLKKDFDLKKYRSFIFKNVDEKMYEQLMYVYIQKLYFLFEQAPAVEKSFYLYRIEKNTERYESNKSLINENFLSCSNDENYLNDRVSSSSKYIRFLVCPGTKILFVKGLSYFRSENEFIMAPSSFSDIEKITLRYSSSIGKLCSDQTKKAYQVTVKPLTFKPKIYK